MPRCPGLQGSSREAPVRLRQDSGPSSPESKPSSYDHTNNLHTFIALMARRRDMLINTSLKQANRQPTYSPTTCADPALPYELRHNARRSVKPIFRLTANTQLRLSPRRSQSIINGLFFPSTLRDVSSQEHQSIIVDGLFFSIYAQRPMTRVQILSSSSLDPNSSTSFFSEEE